MDLKDKNIVYIGGYGGIGQKCIEEFLMKGVKSIFIFDLKENSDVMRHWQESYKSSEICFEPVDVTKTETIEEAYKKVTNKIDFIDVVVNGCGLMNDRHLDLTIDINLRGVLHSCMIALGYMDKSKGGRGGVIANISSVAGIQTTGMFAIYSAAKHGVTAFSRAMSNPLYYMHTGVNFITICPGLTETALLDNVKDKATLLEYAQPMADRFLQIKTQPANVCAENIIKTIEINKVGSVWLLDLGKISEVEISSMWEPEMKHLVICDLHDNLDFRKKLTDEFRESVITYLQIDITKRCSIEMAFQLASSTLRRIDVVVHGCGLMNDRFIDLTMAINLTGVIHSSLMALNYMDKSKGGYGGMIVNISSVAGLEPSGMFAIYSASKCGLTAFTRGMANPLYFANTGVSFVTICPGFTDTALLDSIRGKETLTEYSGPMAERFTLAVRQSAEKCAENLVNVLESAKNGSVWMLDLGQAKEMQLEVLWRPAMNV
ncbi:alcohol dehydrogenase-like [Musca autumnalis]|uniref:alcohol dehydrogenase-like n=1 Tax=Musca autumnalis TaxID=221902 RepID=UPI003CEC079E